MERTGNLHLLIPPKSLKYLRKNGQEILVADKNVADLQKRLKIETGEAERKRKKPIQKEVGDQVQRIKQDMEELENIRIV